MWGDLKIRRSRWMFALFGVGLLAISARTSAQSAPAPQPLGSPAAVPLSAAASRNNGASRLPSPSAISALNLGRYRSSILKGAPASQAPLLLRPQYLMVSRSGLSPLRSAGAIPTALRNFRPPPSAAVAQTPPVSQTPPAPQAPSAPQAASTPQGASASQAAAAPHSAPILTPILYARAMVARGAAGASQSAWAHYQRAEYREAWLSYESVLAVYPDDIRSRLGQVLSELLRGRYEPAAARFDLLRPAAAKEMLTGTFRSEFALRDRAEFDRQRRALSTWTGERPDASLALCALFLWINGETTEALALTDQLRQRYPDSPYADLGDAMRPADDARGG